MAGVRLAPDPLGSSVLLLCAHPWLFCLLSGIVAKDNIEGEIRLNDAQCHMPFQAVCERVHIPNPLLADAYHKRDGTNCWYKYYVSLETPLRTA